MSRLTELGQRGRGALALVASLVGTLVLSGAGIASTDTATAAAGGGWQRLPSAPIAPDFGTARSVWTGTQMLVFGRDTLTKLDSRGQPYSVGTADEAAAFDPATGSWRRLSPGRGPDGSYEGSYSTVWTGKEMVVWGPLDTKAFDPATNRWRRLPPAPAGHGLVVWTGREMIGWGGGCCGDASSGGVAYDPASNRWRRLAHSPLAPEQAPVGAWTGRELIVLVSGVDPADGKPWPARFARAAAYDPARDAWRRIRPIPARRDGATAVWDGRKLLVVGGVAPQGRPARVGFAYDPRTNSWRRLAPMPGPRAGAVAVWTGHRLLVWGGRAGTSQTPLRSGIAYDARTDRWSTLPRAPLPRNLEPSAVWTGRSLIVWGGARTGTWGHDVPVGAVYIPEAP